MKQADCGFSFNGSTMEYIASYLEIATAHVTMCGDSVEATGNRPPRSTCVERGILKMKGFLVSNWEAMAIVVYGLRVSHS
jgi:hypothetical protein